MFSDLPRRRMSFRSASVRQSKPNYNLFHNTTAKAANHNYNPIKPTGNYINYDANLTRSASSVLHEQKTTTTDSEIDVAIGSTGSIFSLIRSESVSATSAFSTGAGNYSNLAPINEDHQKINDNYRRLTTNDSDRSQQQNTKSRSGSKSLIPKSCKRLLHKLGANIRSSSRSAVSESRLQKPMNSASDCKPAVPVQVISANPLPVRRRSKGPSIWERRCGEQIAALPFR